MRDSLSGVQNKGMRFPHAANLFKFCRYILAHKVGGGGRVIDQDVGHLLSLDPTDCSHWKSGKKDIASVHALRALSEHLHIDEQLVMEVASGGLDPVEGFYECMSYGAFGMDPSILAQAKKAFFRKTVEEGRPHEAEFQRWFIPNRLAIQTCVAQIHQTLDYREAPLYLHEIPGHYPHIRLVAVADQESLAPASPSAQVPIHSHFKGSSLVITYPKASEVKAFMRFHIAKEMAAAFLEKKTFPQELQPYADHIWSQESHLFAAYLLAPDALLKKEIRSIPASGDLLVKLAEVFWMSKLFMNQRLKMLF
jgi:hypothetical protein